MTAGKPVASLRWWIGGLLFASTVINYVSEWFPKPERALAPALLRFFAFRVAIFV